MPEGSKKMTKEENDNEEVTKVLENAESSTKMPSLMPKKKWLCKPREAQCSQDCCISDALSGWGRGRPTGGHGSCWAFGSKLSVLSEKRPAQSLMPVSCNDWEYFEFILDSGATTTVIPMSVGRAYEVQPSEASKAGVMYEIANGDEIPNLGEKLMPVVTAEGAWKGLLAQVADISKALQSVRSLVKAGHVVVFGDNDES